MNALQCDGRNLCSGQLTTTKQVDAICQCVTSGCLKHILIESETAASMNNKTSANRVDMPFNYSETTDEDNRLLLCDNQSIKANDNINRASTKHREDLNMYEDIQLAAFENGNKSSKILGYKFHQGKNVNRIKPSQ